MLKNVTTQKTVAKKRHEKASQKIVIVQVTFDDVINDLHLLWGAEEILNFSLYYTRPKLDYCSRFSLHYIGLY